MRRLAANVDRTRTVVLFGNRRAKCAVSHEEDGATPGGRALRFDSSIRLAMDSLIELAPRLRRRAMLVVRQLPRDLRRALEQKAALVCTRVSAASAYNWKDLAGPEPGTWSLNAYVSVQAFAAVQERLNRLDVGRDADEQEHKERFSDIGVGW